jgi:hypothetical protein
MGVPKFFYMAVNPLETHKKEVENNVVAVFIDGQPEIYKCFEDIRLNSEPYNEINLESGGMNFRVKKGHNVMDLFVKGCNTTIDSLLGELDEIKNLKEVHIAMDGTPCYPKLHNQLARRKVNIGFYEDTKLIISDAMTLPNTPVTDTFNKILEEKLRKYAAKRNIIIELCSSNIAGEGEHKMLDMVRRSRYTTFSTNNTDQKILIISNDSDTIISLLSQSYVNIYIKADVTKSPTQKITKYVNLKEIKDNMISTPIQALNCVLVLAFAGNDYLPEMLDSLEIGGFYNRVRNLANFHLTQDLTVKEEDDEYVVRIINDDALRDFLRIMSQGEIEQYLSFTERDGTSDPLINRRPPQFNMSKTDVISNKDGFKEMYYRYVHEQYHKYVLLDKNYLEPTPEEIWDFEDQMALAYLKTYYWYHYYQSGYYVPEPLDNSAYDYGFPPFYNSLLKIFVEKTHLIQFSCLANPHLIPKRRTEKYFENLPSFPELQHFIVLQPRDINAIYGKQLHFLDEEYCQKKIAPITENKKFAVRIAACGIKLYPRPNVKKLLEKFGNSDTPIKRKDAKTTTFGEGTIQKINATRFADKFKVMGFQEIL